MTSQQLTEYGRSVMQRLDMPDWIERAEFKVSRSVKGSDGSECDGLSSWHPEERRCWIIVRQNKNTRFMEETCIHECLHVRLEGHLSPMRMKEYDEGYELGLNRIAEAFWKAWHE